MLDQKPKELKTSNAKHIKKLKRCGVHKHSHLVDDMIVYNGNKIHLNYQKYLTPSNAKT